jgi:hypothetical protein
MAYILTPESSPGITVARLGELLPRNLANCRSSDRENSPSTADGGGRLARQLAPDKGLRGICQLASEVMASDDVRHRSSRSPRALMTETPQMSPARFTDLEAELAHTEERIRLIERQLGSTEILRRHAPRAGTLVTSGTAWLDTDSVDSRSGASKLPSLSDNIAQ